MIFLKMAINFEPSYNSEEIKDLMGRLEVVLWPTKEELGDTLTLREILRRIFERLQRTIGTMLVGGVIDTSPIIKEHERVR